MMRLKSLLILLTIGFAAELQADTTFNIKENQDNLIISTESGDFDSAPVVILHDDFESGTAGQPLQNFIVSANEASQKPTYSNHDSVSGKQSGMSSFLGANYNSSAEYKNLPDLEKVYLSYYFKIDLLNGLPSRNIKLARLSAGYGNAYIQAAGTTLFHNYTNGIFYQGSNDLGESEMKTVWFANYADGKWHRAEQYIKLSNPAKEANGTTIAKLDGKIIAEKINIVNEETGMRYKWLTLPYYVAHDPGGDYKIYYDNVVVSKNRARVELCDNDVYSECKQPIIVKTESWLPKSIAIAKVNLSTKKPYIFVFNESGNIVGKAIHYCPECPASPNR